MEAIALPTFRTDLPAAWPLDRLTRLDNFGHSISSPAFLYRPTHAEQILELFDLARDRSYTVAFRGASRSYGDAALNSGGVVIDFRRMNRILSWDPDRGEICVEPGVTIQQLWQYILEDGWWPPVVPGTMFPTVGGCLAMNVHGKNNYLAGTLGDHVLEFTALLPNGEEISCSPEGRHRDLFYAMIGGLGLLGVFTSITLQMKRVYSGELDVRAWAVPTLDEMIAEIDRSKTETDYIVGWVDTTAGGEACGRGQLHSADYLRPGEDPAPGRTLKVDHQILSDTLFGLVPKSILWKLMRPFFNKPGLKLTNTAKYWSSRTISHDQRYRQSHVAFNFLLDYIPNWERSYGAGGMIQYQSFIPGETAADAFTEMLRLSQRTGIPSFLGVLKRHRPDPYLLSHAVDGFSLAMDFRVTDGNRAALHELTAALDQIVLEADGRFYFAKDSTLAPETVERFLGSQTVQRFRTLKSRCDPEGLLQSDLYRRCFPS